MASLVCPKQIPLHLNVIRTDKGPWLLRVDSVLASNDRDNVALQLVLERVSEDESPVSRRLYVVCPERNLHIPQERVAIAEQIGHWLETTEGNGVLDLEAEVVR